MVLVVRNRLWPSNILFIPSVTESAGDGVSWIRLLSRLSDETRKGEVESTEGVMTSVTAGVITTGFEGDDASAKGGRLNNEVGRVDDIDERTEAFRRFGSFVDPGMLPLTLTLEVIASGEPLAICNEAGRCLGEGRGESFGDIRNWGDIMGG